MIYLIIWAFIFWIVGFILKRKLPFLIGRTGENFVSRKLNGLNPAGYSVLNDLMLPSSGRINTTQIDHVVVSNFGIFVIETKSYKGWIFGSANQKYWMQVIYKYKNSFYNPLYQNFAHVKAIETLTRPLFPRIPVVGLVAFPSAEKLQISGTNAVGSARDIVGKIESYGAEVISDLEKAKIVEILTAANIQDKDLRKMHNANVRAIKNSR